MAKKLKRMPNQRLFVEACYGDLTMAILLWQIVSWYRYAKIGRDGHIWIVNSHEWWSIETGLSERQVRRTMLKLKHALLIKSERHLFGNKVVAWIRPTIHTLDETGALALWA